METQDELGIKYTDMLAEISKYLDELKDAKTASSQSYYHFDDEASMDDLSKLVNGGYSQGIANQVANAGTTITYEKEYALMQDGGFFIYWLMMHLGFLEDEGFTTNYPTISKSVHTWGRSIIRSGVYNELDRAFLEEVREYMTNKKWVYKKPLLNEHNDTLPLIERLPITTTKIKV
jgi:hypothetical protein